MTRRLIGFCLILWLIGGCSYAQSAFSYAKGRGKRSGGKSSITSIRVYDDILGQVLFLRSLKRIQHVETWEIYDDPGGLIRFFADRDSLYATISLGQMKADVWQTNSSDPDHKSWKLSSPGDTVFLQCVAPVEGASAEQIGFRLFKRIHSPPDIQRPHTHTEVDLIHFFFQPAKRPMVRIEDQDSLDDYPEIFSIMALVIVFQICTDK
ncbi:MAG: hypothetical protein AAF587_23065 [Bacteroidota bacterium]